MTKGKPWTKKQVADFAEELIAVTIPINITFEGKQKILDLSQVEKILRSAKTIAVSECQCRAQVKGCDAPLDVCIYLNEQAEEQVQKREGKIISLKESLDILKSTIDAGLVHIAYTDRGNAKPNYICSCCSCCCHSFAAIQKFGFNDALISSDLIAQQDSSLCDNCGLCVDKCHFKARWIDNDELKFEKNKCFGCGLCIQSCPANAITLLKRK